MRNVALFSTAIILLLAGCGGGGGGGAAKPPAPTNFNAVRSWVVSGTNLSQKTELSWDEVNGADTYKLYMQAENEASPKLLKEVNSTTYTHIIPDSLYAFDITYWVSAVASGVEGERKDATAYALPPPAPF